MNKKTKKKKLKSQKFEFEIFNLKDNVNPLSLPVRILEKNLSHKQGVLRMKNCLGNFFSFLFIYSFLETLQNNFIPLNLQIKSLVKQPSGRQEMCKIP